MKQMQVVITFMVLQTADAWSNAAGGFCERRALVYVCSPGA